MLLGPGTSVTAAQQQPATTFCWRAAPQSRCAAFAVIEASYLHRLFTTHEPSFTPGGVSERIPDFESRGAGTAGVLWNRADNTALGVTLSAGGDDMLNAEMRWRHWLRRRMAVDVSMGWTRARAGSGVTAAVQFLPKDLFSASIRSDFVQGKEETKSATYVGVHAGSYGIFVGAVVLLLYSAVVVVGS